jgi:CHAT domain-containing protein/tetratricopeptide (TPR) repeat protein
VLLIPLRDQRSVDAKAEYGQARELFLRGYLAKGQREADLGYKRFLLYDPMWASEFQLLKAEILVARGNYDDALSVLAAYRPPTYDPEGAIRKLVIESIALNRQQQPSLADQMLIGAENLCKNAAYAPCGEALQARGIFAVKQGKLPEAKQFFLDTLTFSKLHDDRYLEASADLNLGWVALQVGRFDEAIDWSRTAYRVCIALGAQDLAEKSSGNLGWAYLQLGDRERALDLFRDAEQRAARLGNIREQLKWLTAAGYVYQDTSDLALATESYQHALGLARQIDSKEDTINSLVDLSQASIEAEKADEASAYVRQLDPLLRANGNRLDLLGVMLVQGRIAAVRREDQQAEAAFRTVESDPASQTSMRLGAEHELARLYESQGNFSAADRMYRTSLTTFESARAQLKNEESKLPFLANATRIYDDYIHFLVQRGKANEALAAADQSRALTLAQGLGLSEKNKSLVRAALHPEEISRKTGSTLLFYWLGAKESYLWTITPKKATFSILPPQREIASVFERYRNALQGPNDAVETSNQDGLTLYRMLVAPAKDLILPNSTVTILNDGVLSQLNFETLIVPDPKPHYFIEDATLISAPSLSLLASAKTSSDSSRKLLLIGDAVSPNPDYPELPMAAFEMRQIQKHFSAENETVFAHEKATSRAYLASQPQQFSFIHFVTHGVASRTDPLDSAIILSNAGTADDSFKLYARDIIQHPIHARLVTISACYGSGTRSYAGEGLVGLSWAFLRAGAHNVIGALWEVSDDSTPRLMSALYQGLDDGLTPSAALRQAKITLLHSEGNFRKPFFWAPFQIYAGL